MSEVKKKDIVVIHHNDLDGYGALAVVYKRFVKNFNVVNFEFNYNTTFEELIRPLNMNNIEAIFILDCNLGGEHDVIFLNSIETMFPNKIAFIDHHEMSDRFKGEMKFDSIVDKSRCGAKLTLNKFFPTERNEIYEYIDMFDRFEFDDIKEYNKSDLLSSLCGLVDKKTFVRNLAFSKNLDDLFGKYENLIKTLKNEYKVILGDEFSPIVAKNDNVVVYKMDFHKVNPLFYPNVNMIRLNKEDRAISVFISKYYENPSQIKFSIRVNANLTDLNIEEYMLEHFKYLVRGGGHQYAFGGTINGDDYTRLLEDIRNIEVPYL